MANKVIVMGMMFDAGSVPDLGGIYAVKMRPNGVNDYGAASESDASKLSSITNAAPGSTCLFSNGALYRLEAAGWAKFGEEPSAANSVSPQPANVNFPSVMPIYDDPVGIRGSIADDETDGGEMI